MSGRSSFQKINKACKVCTRRKVKCNKQIPCDNCIKRGEESECIKSVTDEFISNPSIEGESYLQGILKLWQSYEYWITDIGLLKTKNTDSTKKIPNFDTQIAEWKFWSAFIDFEQSFKLLNFTVENLGPLYFGCLGDINDLFIQLEVYWQRQNTFKDEPSDDFFSIEDTYRAALLWSVFSMCIYYMPIEDLSQILPVAPLCEFLGIDQNQEWSESLQLTAYQGFTKCTLKYLERANYNRNPDIRFVQSFIILSTTNFVFSDSFLVDSLLLQSVHIGKYFRIDSHKQYAGEDLTTDISKSVFSKIWLHLCIMDYRQENPNRRGLIHTEIPSLLQHAAFYQDMANFNVYQQEDSLESLFWKITSLERDLDKFLTASFKPQIKTFDAIKRELNIFDKKIHNTEFEPKSINAQFQRFLSSFLLSSVQWKLHKMYLIYFNSSNALDKSAHYVQILIKLIESNMNRGYSAFNKHPLVLQTLSRVVPFYSFYNIFEVNPQVETLNNDLANLLLALPVILGEKWVGLSYLIQRLNSLGIIWEKVRVEGTSKNWSHPVLKIIQDDVRVVSKMNSRTLTMIQGAPSFGDITNLEENEYTENDDEYFSRNKISKEFKYIVDEFEKEHSIVKIFT